MTKYVYLFSEGNKEMRNLLGGKGANLAEMTKIGLPVPQGFTVTTEACTKYYEDGKKLCGIPSELADVVIRIFDFCGGNDIDLEKVILEKMEYNETRPYKHGKKC